MKKLFFCEVTDEEFQKVSDYFFEKVNNIHKKPPLGLEPKYIHDEKRIDEIKEAMRRYIDAGIEAPKSWWEELMDLLEIENQRLLKKINK